MTRVFIEPRNEPLATLELCLDGDVRLLSKREGLQNANVLFSSAAVPVYDGPPPFTIYVDSAAGNDANDGTTAATALQTLSAADADLVTSSRLGMVNGSEWREALIPGENSLTIGATGDGLVTIDGSEAVAGTWTAHGSEANVWEFAGWTHDGTSTNRLTIYEDGQLLTRVTTAAACSALAGSFVDIKGSDGSPVTLRIHATGSGNPNSNGKAYRASKRTNVFAPTGNGLRVSGIHTKRQIGNNGSFVITGTDAVVSRILASDGHKHNFFMASGTASDCLCFAADPATSYELANATFVSFMPDPSAASFVYDRCGATQPTANGAGGTAFYAHGNPNPYLAGTIRQCWVVGNLTFEHPGGGATARANAISQGCYARAASANLGYGIISYQMFYGTLALGTVNLFADATITDSAMYIEERYDNANYNEFIRMSGTGTRVLSNCALVCEHPGNTNMMANSTATAGTLAVNETVIFGFGNGLWLDTDVTYTGDYNIFWGGGANDFQGHDGTSYRTTLATWQSNTGQDANSVRCAAADQVAGGANALWLGYAEAAPATDLTTIGPAVGDFRINPDARVYSGAGTPYIGTYADGIKPLTDAGPQNYWDWNTRTTGIGAPSAFPAVPDTLAESITYVSDPAAWNFYP